MPMTTHKYRALTGGAASKGYLIISAEEPDTGYTREIRLSVADASNLLADLTEALSWGWHAQAT